MKALIAGLVLLAACATTHAKQSPSPQLASFSLVITSTPNSWAARCEAGCSWRTASFKCADACDVAVDANGLTTVATPRTEPTAFAFRLAHGITGLRAESQTGTAWKTLTWECGTASCTARIDELGVSGGAAPQT
jgi:hypothetical protein